MAITKHYDPIGADYRYISDVSTDADADVSKQDVQVLASNGKDADYSQQYCNTVCFGAHEMSFNARMRYNPNAIETTADAMAFMMGSPNINYDIYCELQAPIETLYSKATHFGTSVEFGQEEGEDVPAKCELVYLDGGGTQFKWSKNGTVVGTDTSGNKVQSFALAVVLSGTTITGYAYIYYYNSEIWTTGLKSDPDVINILNTGGTVAKTETVHAWETDKGDFIFSLIFSESGTSAYTGVCARDTSYTIDYDLVNNILVSNCEAYNGYLGTDLVSFLAETESNAEGWAKFNDPSFTSAEVEIPSDDGHVYTLGYYKTTTIPGSPDPITLNNVFVMKIDGVYSGGGYLQTDSYMRHADSYVFLTWYPQSGDFYSKDRILWVSIDHNVQGLFYEFNSFFGFNNTTFKDMTNVDESDGYANGYDGEGQEDEDQDDPDDVEDPSNDPLGTGFLYAFEVSGTDMVNLQECLVPDTLSQKIRADFGNNLFEFIVSYHMMPCLTNADTLNKVHIAYRGVQFEYGENNTPLALAPISKTWYSVSCGTKYCMPKTTKSDLMIRQDGFENWADAQVQLYLPFIGFVHLNTVDVWNQPISIQYRFDILQGTCVALVGVGQKGTIYTFEGSCKYTIPITTAVDHANQQLLSGIFSGVTSAVSVGGAIAGGNPVGIVGALGGVADSVGGFLSASQHKSTINRSGCLSGTPGWNMPRKPALIITIPDVKKVDDTYRRTNGYPCCKSVYLSGYTGEYVEVGQVELTARENTLGASPNDSELDMINAQLKGGVYV